MAQGIKIPVKNHISPEQTWKTVRRSMRSFYKQKSKQDELFLKEDWLLYFYFKKPIASFFLASFIIISSSSIFIFNLKFWAVIIKSISQSVPFVILKEPIIYIGVTLLVLLMTGALQVLCIAILIINRIRNYQQKNKTLKDDYFFWQSAMSKLMDDYLYEECSQAGNIIETSGYKRLKVSLKNSVRELKNRYKAWKYFTFGLTGTGLLIINNLFKTLVGLDIDLIKDRYSIIYCVLLSILYARNLYLFETPINVIGNILCQMDINELQLDIDKASLSSVEAMKKVSLENKTREINTTQTVDKENIYRHALELFENEEETNRWLSTPKTRLQGKTPLEAMETQAGIEKVQQILYQTEFGMFT
jgi:putative toxin-antitoxin system antitoxin component (TIGR02293 family)